jgi:hypothetical protein
LRFARWVLFLFCFQLEISVKAADPVRVAGARTEILELASGTLFVLPRGLVENRGPDTWRLLEGRALGRAKDASPLSLETLHGSVKTSGEVAVIARENSSRVVIRAVKGDASVRLRDGRELALGEGLELEIGPVTSEGRNFHKLPVPIEIAAHLADLALVPGMDFDKLKVETAVLKTLWKGAGARAATLYGAVIERHVASVREADEAQARRARAAAEERASFRRLLQKKAFEE